MKLNFKNILAGVGIATILLIAVYVFFIIINSGKESKQVSGKFISATVVEGTNPPELPGADCIAKKFSFTGYYFGSPKGFYQTLDQYDTQQGWTFSLVGKTIVFTNASGKKTTLGTEVNITDPSAMFYDQSTRILYVQNGDSVVKLQPKCGIISIQKIVKTGESEQEFPFVSSFPAFSLSDGGAIPDRVDLYVDNDGTKTFTENPMPAGWDLDSLICEPSSPKSSWAKVAGKPSVSVNITIPDVVTCGFTNVCNSEGWIEKAGVAKSAPGSEYFGNIYGVGGAINGKVYFGGGFGNDLKPNKNFYEYTPSTASTGYGTWRKVADMPLVGGKGITGATTFVLGGKLYVMGGFLAPNWDVGKVTSVWLQNFNTPVNYVFEYDPANGPLGTWTQKKNAPWAPRGGAVSFVIGDKGYMGTGQGGFTTVTVPAVNKYSKPTKTQVFTAFKDFWQYDNVNDSWTQKNDLGNAGNRSVNARAYAVGFSIGGNGYIGTGRNPVDSKIAGRYVDFWQYNPVSDKWTAKAGFAGGGMAYGIGFSIGNAGYIGGGPGKNGTGMSTWKYDPEKNSWQWKNDINANTGFAMSFDANSDGTPDTAYYVTRQDNTPTNGKNEANRLFKWANCGI